MRWRGVGIGVAVVAVLGACSHSDKASTLPAGPTVTASPTPSESSYPATPEGAADFVRHFYQVIDEAYARGDSAELRRLSLPDCDSCGRLADSVDLLRRQNQRLSGGNYDLKYAIAAGGAADPVVVSVGYSAKDASVTEADGRVVKTFPAVADVEEDLTLHLRDNRWRVAKIIQLRRS